MSLISRCPAQNFDVIQSVGILWTEYGAIAPAAHSYDEVLTPKYFGAFRVRDPRSPSGNDNGIRVGDYINVRAENALWQARLVVRDVPAGSDEVWTEQIDFVSFDAKDIPEGYSLDFRGPHRRWVITLNGEVIEGGFATKESANNRIKFFESTSNAQARVQKVKSRGRQRKAAPAQVSAEVVD